MIWPTAIDLFSGIGGLTLGLRRARYRVVAAVDHEPLAAESYRSNFPSVRLYTKDVREIDGEELLSDAQLSKGELGLLAGCPPCQGFSSLRTRNGKREAEDERNDLVIEFLRFAEQIEPQAVMMENVPGLERDARFSLLRDRLEWLGYQVSFKVLDAMECGVPQRRSRLLLVACKGGRINLASGRSGVSTVWDAIGSLRPAGASHDPLHDHGEKRSSEVRAVIARIPPDGGSRADLGKAAQLRCHTRCDGFYDIYGRMRWDGPAPTITGGCINPSKGRFLHPTENRAITLREAAILQGFPNSFRVSLTRGKYAAAELIGNALPPDLIRGQAREVRKLVTIA